MCSPPGGATSRCRICASRLSPENREILQSSVPEALFVDASDAEGSGSRSRGVRCARGGSGDWGRRGSGERLNRLLETKGLGGVALDADALTLLGAGRLPAFSDAAGPNRRLLTPHPGEMARLGAEPSEIRANSVQVCRRGAEQWAAALPPEGPTLADHQCGGRTGRLSATGSSDLARAGIGDVLTAWLGRFSREVPMHSSRGRWPSISRVGLLRSPAAERRSSLPTWQIA